MQWCQWEGMGWWESSWEASDAVQVFQCEGERLPITKALFGLVLLWVTDNSNKCCKKEGMWHSTLH